MTTTKTLLRHYERWGKTIEEIAKRDPNWSHFDVRMFRIGFEIRVEIAKVLAKRGIETPKQSERC